MRSIKWTLCIAAFAALLGVTAGCNTTEGFGKDLESGGKAIKQSAQDHNH